MPGWRTFKFSLTKVTQQHEEVQASQLTHVLTSKPNYFIQKFLIKNECFFVKSAAWYWHMEPVCHWSQPSAQQLSDPTWSKLSSFRFQGCVNSQDDRQWQPGYQPKHSSWQKVRELQWDKDGEQGDIFLWTGSVFPLSSQERARNNSRAVQLSFFPDTNLIQIQEN